MRLIITLFILAFAQLFFNIASASPQAPVNVSSHKAEKKSAREDERRKRRPLKTSAKKTRVSPVQKLKLKKQKKSELTASHLPAKKSKTLLKTASKKRYGHQRLLKTADASSNDSGDTGTIKMSKSHRQRYQKARETAMTKLMGQLGKPYQWGGTSPHTGFDCSGLVWYAYKDLVKFKIPRTANEMYHLRDAAPVKRESLEKGDLVFFRINGRGTADHVGVYLGNGKFIQSPRTGKDIQISALGEDYWQRHYIGARRVMTPKTIR
ncbi:MULTISPECIES: C40 family peptidase [Pantoea]|jgi:murein DD-endopeptidase|uniref:C40 family peptidase n=1 Tax=Pantoea brenneri TaxID=472694 RepID=A0A653TQY6_9GAMM|nr:MULTISPECIES: C40 family peptidase [Pantoea]KKD33475.1 endopeptidase [Pantoea sp. 3.5.1]MBS6034633.1 C40 family peptidase [Pantoea sp.]MBZ6393435.1 C40 family peptidase [Pantoea sp.]MBZ6437582.1 C40 family peptidase [Pantoea sp.]MCQ5470160.1 C40 family peptidase [Pantoea brenneri]